MTEIAEKVNESSSSSSSLITKQSIRRNVWDYLEKNHLVNFPRPVFRRIPNFRGCEEAATKVTELDMFKCAQNIKVNPDKPQEPVRFSVLEHQKNLFVPVPRLASGLLKHICLPEDAIKDDIRRAVSRRGIDECGKEIGLNNEAKIDLVIMGSVAVSKQGYRIGKGKGYADLEFAILSHLKAVNENTIIITTVHDSQVFDDLPPDIFGVHDVPVDIIVTPTQIIYVENPLPKPKGIFWGLLSQRRINLMPILKLLREQDEKLEKDTTLKEIDSDVENYVPRDFRKLRRVRFLPPKNNSNEQNDRNNENRQPNRRRRIIRRKRPENGEDNENICSQTENDSPVNKRKARRSFRKNRSMIDFSLVVRNIEKNVRVRDLKAALAERGIKPNLITWRGMKGYCCLHFSKTNPNTISDPEKQSHGVDNVLGMLQNLTINSESKKQLSIEIMKPISRIETTDVTAV